MIGLETVFSPDGLARLIVCLKKDDLFWMTTETRTHRWNEQIGLTEGVVDVLLLEVTEGDELRIVAERKSLPLHEGELWLQLEKPDNSQIQLHLTISQSKKIDTISQNLETLKDNNQLRLQKDDQIVSIGLKQSIRTRSDRILGVIWKKNVAKEAPNEDLMASLRLSSQEQDVSLFDSDGILEVEFVGLHDAPLVRRRIRGGLHLNAFLTASLGMESIRTGISRPDLSDETVPLVLWRQKARFNIKPESILMSVSLYHHENFQPNRILAKCEIQVKRLTASLGHHQNFAIYMNGEHDTTLLIRSLYIPHKALKKRFWMTIAKNFCVENNLIEKVALEAMLDALGIEDTDELMFGEFENLPLEKLASILIENESKLKLSNSHCPFCRNDASDLDHYVTCFMKYQKTGMDRLLLGGYITEEAASRKWFTRMLSQLSYGKYKIGQASNTTNILVMDRKSGRVIEERIPTMIRLGIRMMYRPRRILSTGSVAELRMANRVCAKLTLRQGRKFDDPQSVSHIAPFIEYHGINVEEIADPLDSFGSFNEFFYRKLKNGARTPEGDHNTLVSPTDARCLFYDSVSEAQQFWIKGKSFSIDSLLKDSLYKTGASMMICRLAPQDYHRFHSPVDGKITLIKHLPGSYYTVNPMAIRGAIDVLTENARTVITIENEKFGTVCVVAVGAMLVGSIRLSVKVGESIGRLQELGYFAFGGSTVITIISPGLVNFDKDLLENSRLPIETLLCAGNRVGTLKNSR